MLGKIGMYPTLGVVNTLASGFKKSDALDWLVHKGKIYPTGKISLDNDWIGLHFRNGR